MMPPPTTKLPPPNSNNVTPRLAASPKRASDVTASPGKVLVTKAAYRAVQQNAAGDVNLKVKRVCHGHNLCAQLMMNLTALITDYNPQALANKGREEEVREVHNALRQCYAQVERAWKRWPVEVVG